MLLIYLSSATMTRTPVPSSAYTLFEQAMTTRKQILCTYKGRPRGMALKNNDVGGGGTSEHSARARLRAARRQSAEECHLISPLRDDLPTEIEAVWHPIAPGTDVALMLGIAHTLVTDDEIK
jgi:hypothetical protein